MEMMERTRRIAMGVLAGAALLGAGMAQAVGLNGAGATFPYPIYSKWFYEYNKAKGVQINYQSIGSGGGIRQVVAGTVDFGGSDGIMPAEQIAQVKGGVLHIPTVAGAVVVAYNLGVPKLKLSPKVLTSIFMGQITKWNDPAIAEINSGVSLPDTNITVAYRSDGSGTTNIFTSYLSKVSVAWASQVGQGTSVKFPKGVGGKGNEGVAGLIKQIPGCVGYVELAYAMKNDLNYASVQNKAGNFITPSEEATTAAMDGMLAKMPADFTIMITNAGGERSYPISGFTWLLVNQTYKDAAKGEAVVEFLKWAMSSEAQDMAKELHYAPLPASLVKKIKAKIGTIIY
jgi:phosphate transport system substrate-binding protein